MGIVIEKMDCLEMLQSMDGESIDMVFADPPFNVNKKYRGYKDKRVDYIEWCDNWIAECFRVLKYTGSFYLMTIDKHLQWKLPIMAQYGVFINLIKWKNVSATHDKRGFWKATQPIMLYGKSDQYKFNQYAQVRDDDDTVIAWNKKRRANAKNQLLDYWDDIPMVYAGSIIHKEAILEPGTRKKAHPCQMPEMLAGRAILFSTDEGDTVLDPFSGSGTTAAVCQKLGRNFRGCDDSSVYVEQSNNRIKQNNFNLFN